MDTAFRCDVAVSYLCEDVLTAARLMDQLRCRVGAPVFDAAETDVGARHDATAAALRSEARVVVVLDQHPWGETPATRCDRALIEERVARDGAGFLVVVMLDPSRRRPDWASEGVACVALSADGEAEMDAIVSAVRRAGGVVPSGPSPEAATVTARGDAELPEPARHTLAMLNAAHREVGRVIDGIVEGAAELRACFPEVEVGVRRTPERCVVQAGPVALSASWLSPSPATDGGGTLLVLEWEGTVTLHGEPMHGRHRATVVREHAFRLDALTFLWSVDEAPRCTYATRDLISLCLRRVRWQLDTRQPATRRPAGTEAP
ncbi:MAG: hypothetical protein IRY91_02360 [Gemmatimonadaceae bacterium]|nr:hypothetical protein [Gemmatimonadaceae bacterium]